MMALGSNVHIFARPHRREELAWCFETVLGCGPVRTVEHPAMEQPMLLVSFPGGGHSASSSPTKPPTTTSPGWEHGSNCGPMIRRRSCAPRWRQAFARFSTQAIRITSWFRAARSSRSRPRPDVARKDLHMAK